MSDYTMFFLLVLCNSHSFPFFIFLGK